MKRMQVAGEFRRDRLAQDAAPRCERLERIGDRIGLAHQAQPIPIDDSAGLSQPDAVDAVARLQAAIGGGNLQLRPHAGYYHRLGRPFTHQAPFGASPGDGLASQHGQENDSGIRIGSIHTITSSRPSRGTTTAGA
jgi:hypothetical protein